MTPRALRSALIGLAVLAVAVGAAARALTWDEPTLAGAAAQDLGRPVKADPEAVEELTKDLSRWSRQCEAEPATPDRKWFARLDAVARVECEDPATGVETVTGYQFRTAAHLRADLDDILRFFPLAAGTCQNGGPGRTFWSTRAGRRAGSLVCDVSAGKAYLYWTDDRTRRRFVVSGESLAPLMKWWDRAERRQRAYPTAAEKRLLALVDDAVDIDDCRRAAPSSPTAVAQISCDGAKGPGGRGLGANYIHFATFGSKDDADGRLGADQQAFAPRIPYRRKGLGGLGLAKATYSVWNSQPDNEVEGDLLQDPHAGDVWIGWTLESKRLYGRIGRGDQNHNALWDSWHKLAVVGLND